MLSRAELEQLADVALSRDLLVISDEVHADLVHAPSHHVPFASLSDEIARRTVTLYSATKAFNLAGLRCAVAHVGGDRILARLDRAPDHFYGVTSVPGVEATLAAWRDGNPWLAAVTALLGHHRALVTRRLDALHGVDHLSPQGTYLSWIDCRRLELDVDPAAWFRQHGVVLSPGADFGPGGQGHVRLNFATSTAILEQILDRIAGAVGSR